MKHLYPISALCSLLLLGACESDVLRQTDNIVKTDVYEVYNKENTKDPAYKLLPEIAKTFKFSLYQDEEFVIRWVNKSQTIDILEMDNFKDLSNDTLFQVSFDCELNDTDYQLQVNAPINAMSFYDGKYYGSMVITTVGDSINQVDSIEIQMIEVQKYKEID